MSEIVYRRAETDDAEAIYVFGRQLLSETSLCCFISTSARNPSTICDRHPTISRDASAPSRQCMGRRYLRR